jgi:glyoxylase-like metal-dependent hydrolase (beta-lactamase superfamily II)
MATGVKRIYMLDFGMLAGERGWFIPDPAMIMERGKPKPAEWVDIPVTGAIIEHKDGIILFDTGVHPEAAEKWPKPTFNVFPVTSFKKEEHTIENQLKKINLTTRDVAFVVFSHLHLDHAGQAFIFKDHNTPMVVHRKELQTALYRIWMNKGGAYLDLDLMSLKGANWFVYDGEFLELLPGVEIHFSGGHTPGHVILKILTDAGNTYIFTGDFVHLSEEYEVENKGWLLENREDYIANLKKIKLWAKRSKAKVVISHDPQFWEKYPRAPSYLE